MTRDWTRFPEPNEIRGELVPDARIGVITRGH